MSEEQNIAKTSGKSAGKKWGIIGGIAIVLIALIAGIVIYNTSANRLSRQLDLGNRYLEEQDYEQAVIAFNKAIAIDPMNVDAYLGLADAYIGMGDLQSALDTLQNGYELTNDERLKAKLDEVEAELMQQMQAEEEVQQAADGTGGLTGTDTLNQTGSESEEAAGNITAGTTRDENPYPIELPFSLSDITIQGYDLIEPHMDEVLAAFGCAMGEKKKSVTEYMESTNDTESEYYEIWQRFEYEKGGGSHSDGQISYLYNKARSGGYFIQLSIDELEGDFYKFPVSIGDPYEECYGKLGIDIVKNAPDTVEESGSDDVSWSLVSEDALLLDTPGGPLPAIGIRYTENFYTQYDTYSSGFDLHITISGEEGYDISISSIDGETVSYISISHSWN